jgi:hypothetical protein
MGFFDHALHRPPAPTEPRQRQRAMPGWVKPEAEVPRVVELATVLARSEKAAVALGQVRAYSSGFEFDLFAVLRRAELRSYPFWPIIEVHGDEIVPSDILRIGLQFADGAVLTNVDRRVGDADPGDGPRGPMLTSGGSHAGQRRQDATFWVWPLPPPGPLTFVVEWPARQIPESRHEIDASLILDAAARVIELWPGEPSIVDDWAPTY